MISHFGNPRRIFSAVFFFWIILFLTQGVLVPLTAASPAEDEDFGIWNSYDLEKKLKQSVLPGKVKLPKFKL